MCGIIPLDHCPSNSLSISFNARSLSYVKIPENFDYMQLKAMSMESREKLSKEKPRTIAEAQKISGVSPSDISVLLIHFGR